MENLGPSSYLAKLNPVVHLRNERMAIEARSGANMVRGFLLKTL